MFVLLFIGFGVIFLIGSCNTIIQTIVDEDKRGRVMSLYTMAFMGMGPFGSLLVGSISSRIGVQLTLLICGIFCLAGGILFQIRMPVFRKNINPIYKKLGLIKS